MGILVQFTLVPHGIMGNPNPNSNTWYFEAKGFVYGSDNIGKDLIESF